MEVSDLGIIAVVPDEWGGMWQVRHHLLSRMAQRCHVAWVSPGHHWRAALKRRPPLRGPAPGMPHLQLCDAPRWLPRFHGSPRLDRLTLGLRLRAARAALIRAGASRIVLYLWRPEFAPALQLVPYDLSCYHIDDEYSFSTTEVAQADEELELLQRVGQVFIHSGTLLAAKGEVNAYTSYLPNGVDYGRYSTTVPEPEDLRRIPGPRIGYAGWLKPQLDWDVLIALAIARPEWSFVMIGPQGNHPEVAASVERLRPLANVHLLGGRPTSMLHAYTQHFDVCLMPYKLNWYTQYIYPVKVHEYLATGSPVVASRLPNLQEFGDVVTFANDATEWSAAIARALESRRDTGQTQARQAVAQRHDWSALAARALSVLEGRLALEAM